VLPFDTELLVLACKLVSLPNRLLVELEVVVVMMVVMVVNDHHNLRLRRIRRCEAEDEEHSEQILFHASS
jgi:hypothetical protein